MNAFVAADDLSYKVRGRAIVRNASLALETGQVTVIVGPNGAGKSTLLKLLTGELSATSGTVAYSGQPITAIPAWRLACQRAVMAQAARMAFPFTVHEAARIGLDGVGRALPRLEKARIVAEALAVADIQHLADRPLQLLSGGEQQRAHFARVLCQLKAGRSMATEQALFLDEPVASLDLKHQLALMDAARTLADSGIAVIAVLHDLNLALAYADRIVVMKEGAIVAAGALNAVLDRQLVKDVFEVDLLRSYPGMALPFILPQVSMAIEAL